MGRYHDPMPEVPPPSIATQPPSSGAEREVEEPTLLVHVVGAVVVWAVVSPVVDWVSGDLISIRASAVKGAVIGCFWGLAMHWLSGWLRRRGSAG